MAKSPTNEGQQDTADYLKWWTERNSRPGFFGEATVEGLTVSVHRGVFSPDPRVTFSSAALIHALPDLTGKTVLDLGTGSGILAIHAALKGASRVTAVDIQPEAVQNAQENIDKYLCGEIVEIFQSNVFSTVNGQFDIIIANLPFMVLSYVLNHVATDTYRRFFADVKVHLAKHGKAFVTFACWGDRKTLEEMIQSTQLQWRMVTEEFHGKEWYVYELWREDETT